MSIQKFGLRYERLLVLSAPISLVCILVAFVAIASDTANDKAKAACYDSAATLVEADILEPTKLGEKRETIGNKTFANEYVNENSMEAIVKFTFKCGYDIVHEYANATRAPAESATLFRSQAQQIRDESAKRPVRSYGIEIAEKAVIPFLGTTISVNILTLTQVMQLTLFPILLLWFGSLFNTRYRETILIETAKSISELYPHVINVYINARIPELRKKSWAGYYVKKSLPYIPTVFRILILSIFILPPTIFYCASLFYLESNEYIFLSAFSGFLVSIFALVNITCELSPWHAGKTFPGSKFYSNRNS